MNNDTSEPIIKQQITEDKSDAGQNIDANVQNTMNIVFDAAKRILDAVAETPGKKTTLRDLIDKVVYETKVQVSVANGLVPMFVHNWEKAGHGEMKRGRNGGIFPGGRVQRIDPRTRCQTCNQVIRFDKKSEPKLIAIDDIEEVK